MTDRGRETSYALVEVRTVLSRAETTLRTFDGWMERMADNECAATNAADPDLGDMTEALCEVVRLLERWRRTGRPLKNAKGTVE